MRPRGAHVLLGVALIASAGLLLHFVSHLTFIGDDWDLLIVRQAWPPDAFLQPYNENLVLAPALLYKVLLTIFGMDSALPFYLVSIALFLLCAVLVFVHLRRRAGEWLALLAAVLVLFLGAAYEDIFWAFQMGFFGSIAAGLGALIALEREDRLGDRLACGLLILSLAFGSVGIPFVAAALADVALGRSPRGRRAYVALLPLAAYALWWLGWGQAAGSHISFETALHVPRYVFDAAGGGIASLLGREAMAPSGHPPLMSQVLVIAVMLIAALKIARQREIPRGLVIAFALALAFWVLIGLNRTGHDRFALSSRYQYPSAVFILLIAGELVRGISVPRIAFAAAAAIAVGGVAGGISLMHRHHSGQWEGMSNQIRLTVSAVEIAGASARSDFPVSFPPSISVPAGQYLSASERYGSPAYSESDLLARPEADRQYVDHVVAKALGIGVDLPNHGLGWGRCLTLPTGRTDERHAMLGPGKFVVANPTAAPAKLQLSRFATDFAVELSTLPARAFRVFTIPGDTSNRRWRLDLAGGTLRLCSA